MIHSWLRTFISVGFLSITTQVQAQHLDRVAPDLFFDDAVLSKINFGLVCPSGTSKKLAAPNTHMGFITQREQHHRIEHTTQIVPLTIGVGFGVDVQLPNGIQLREVEISVFHPAYIGTSVTEESWKTDLNYQDSNLNFFLFEFPFEMVAGDWAIQASYQGDVIYSVGFRVVDPSKVPNLSSFCSGALLS